MEGARKGLEGARKETGERLQEAADDVKARGKEVKRETLFLCDVSQSNCQESGILLCAQVGRAAEHPTANLVCLACAEQFG